MTTTSTARVSSPAEFLFAGKAEFTLRSVATGAHFTYKVTQSDDGRMYFVAVLQDGRKQYAGCIPADARTTFRSTRGSKIAHSHVAVMGFEWFLTHLESPQVELHHCGKCGRCGRKLTNPESIALGIGPECASKLTDHQLTQARRDAGWAKVMEGELSYLEQCEKDTAEAWAPIDAARREAERRGLVG